jgi:hypothetical protein
MKGTIWSHAPMLIIRLPAMQKCRTGGGGHSKN